MLPVFMKVWAGSWLIASVWRLRTIAIRSAIRAEISGKIVEMFWPLWPARAKGCCGAKHLRACPWSWAICCPFVKLSGIGWPFIATSFGLWSKVSRWVMPPAK
jgi:hypothetical protein